jgi:hypothetical protein
MQDQLPTGVEPEQESDSQTVYAVVVRWEGSPHPDVLGVYDDEDAADELMRKCRDWPREFPGFGPVAWEKREQEIQSGFDPEEVKAEVP